jgi:hypothetical protein
MLLQTTVINTKLLNSVADLTESKLDITRALNSNTDATTQSSDGDRVAKTRDKEERARIASYVQLQAREIESLRIELFMLKRKDTSSLTMPTPIPPQGQSQSQIQTISQTQPQPSFLPPIPSAKK